MIRAETNAASAVLDTAFVDPARPGLVPFGGLPSFGKAGTDLPRSEVVGPAQIHAYTFGAVLGQRFEVCIEEQVVVL